MQRETVGRPMEILLVEDSLMQARLTMGAIRNHGIVHHPTWLSDGLEAMSFLKRQGKFTSAPRPDLILLDLLLPGLSGAELLAARSEEPELSRIPVIVMTGAEDGPEDLKALRLTVDGFLRKPIQMPEFLGLLEQLNHRWEVDMIRPVRAAEEG